MFCNCDLYGEDLKTIFDSDSRLWPCGGALVGDERLLQRMAEVYIFQSTDCILVYSNQFKEFVQGLFNSFYGLCPDLFEILYEQG